MDARRLMVLSSKEIGIIPSAHRLYVVYTVRDKRATLVNVQLAYLIARLR